MPLQAVTRGLMDMLVLVAMLFACLVIESAVRLVRPMRRSLHAGTSEFRNCRALSDQLKPLP